MDTTSPEDRPGFTPRQGQYLAFIHAYRRLHGRAPAETNIQRFFRVSPPSVHQMLLTLERTGLISRQPRVARSVTLTIDPQRLPELHSEHDQPVKTSVQRYEAFNPRPEEIARAHRILAAADAAARGGGAFTVEGQMVDAPFIARARALVDLAERMGLAALQ